MSLKQEIKKLSDPKWFAEEWKTQTDYVIDDKRIDITYRYAYSVFSIILTALVILAIKNLDFTEWPAYFVLSFLCFLAFKSWSALIKYWINYKKMIKN